MAAEQLFVSAVTVGEIQAGIEITREQDEAKAEELEAWLDKVLVSYGVLPMDAPAFREWARLMHGRSDTTSEDAMIAATAIVHRLTVVTRNAGLLFGVVTFYDLPGSPMGCIPLNDYQATSAVVRARASCRLVETLD